MDSDAIPVDRAPSDGLYILTNKASRTVLDLEHGNAALCTKVMGQDRKSDGRFLNFVWMIRQNGPDGTYTMKNARSNTVLDLYGGLTDDNSVVQGFEVMCSSPNQYWKIQVEGAGFYSVQNPRAKTFLEIKEG